VAMDEFVDFLKGEFVDAVYLQQNAFDKTDEATPRERQEHVMQIIIKVLDHEFSFATKEEARKFFVQMRQRFINWNSTVFGSAEFKKIQQDILADLI
jgi:V/A-type H+-transporting ATPase subunit A